MTARGEPSARPLNPAAPEAAQIELSSAYCWCIATASVSILELAELLRSPYVDEEVASGTNVFLVDLDTGPTPQPNGETTPSHKPGAPNGPGALPVVIIGITRHPLGAVATHPICDVVVDAADPILDEMLSTIERRPIAATSLAVLLRATEHQSIEHALAAESAVYSLLQSGPEFAAWRQQSTRTHRPAAPDQEPAVVGARVDDVLRIELNRPHRHNAFSRSMRDALTELLALALLDDSIREVHLSGRGPSFCSGGDLTEFGSFDDPATAHRTRLTRSPARLIDRLAGRMHVRLHGACMGAGIELPAFAKSITADRDTVIALPEIRLGLIPGAGGTVSLPRRIGRQRTAYLALSGVQLTADAARQWGLIDFVSP